MGLVLVAFAPALLISTLAGGTGQAGGVCAVALPESPREVIVAPGESLQAAIDGARAGAVIRLKPGTYPEAIRIAGFRDTSAENPLVITSTDGPGTVTILPPAESADKPTIFITRSSHVILDGLSIVGTADGKADSGPVKIINGADEEAADQIAGDITISNSLISGSGSDCVKVAKAHNLTIVGNVFTGVYSDACLDLVTVWDSDIRFNDFLMDSNNGITMKGGSQNITVANNMFRGLNLDPSIKIGGEGHSRAKRDAPGPDFIGFEARNITVRENVIQSQGPVALWFQGAQDSLFEGNFVTGGWRSALYATMVARSSPWRNETGSGPPYHNKNNSIRDNILEQMRGDSGAGSAADPAVAVAGNGAGALADAGFPYGRDGCGASRP
jgi:hypothetical protein